MKLGFQTNAYTNGRWSLEDAIRRIAKAGYGGVTILADMPHLWVPTMSQGEFQSLKDVLSETGLYVSNVNGFTAQGYDEGASGAPGQKFGPIFSDSDSIRRQWKIEYTKSVIDIASALGDAQNVSIGSGYPLPDVPHEVAWKWMSDAINVCAEYASIRGVHLNIEAEPGLLVGNVNDCDRLINDIDAITFGVNFDTGHFYAAGEDVVDAIYYLDTDIQGVDLEDIKVSDIGRVGENGLPVHEHEVPGDGDMPLMDILNAFSDIGYEGWYNVELYNHGHHPVEVTERSIRALRPMFKELAK